MIESVDPSCAGQSILIRLRQKHEEVEVPPMGGGFERVV
jgi:hypothetical protein